MVSEVPGPHSEPLQRVSQELGVFLCYGTYERAPGQPRGTVYNSAVLLGPSGDILGVYRKTHLFPTERRRPRPAAPSDAGNVEPGWDGWSTPGTEPCVVHTPIASIGMSICYDGDFPELFRAEALMGAEVILRPSALLRSFEIWELTNRGARVRQPRLHGRVQRRRPGCGRQLLLRPQHDRRPDQSQAGARPGHRRGDLRRAATPTPSSASPMAPPLR